MELITARIHSSIGSFPSSSSLTGFLTSEDGISPVKAYPVYVSKKSLPDDHKETDHNPSHHSQHSRSVHAHVPNVVVVLNEDYKVMHQLPIEHEIHHISCWKSKMVISTSLDVRILQKYNKELRTLCILDEEKVFNSCFFLHGLGLCIAKRNKITLYSIDDIIKRYQAQMDAIERQKEKIKKRLKIRRGLQSEATTPRSMMSETSRGDDGGGLHPNDHFSFQTSMDDDEINELEMNDIMDDLDTIDAEQSGNALVVRYRTIYIETLPPIDRTEDDEKRSVPRNTEPDGEWRICAVTMSCTQQFWWIGILDNSHILHVIKLRSGWPNTSNISHILSTPNTHRVALWRPQESIAVSRSNRDGASWFIGMWTWYNHNTVHIAWYTLCNKSVLVVLDQKGTIHLWNEPEYNYVLSSSTNEDHKFIFRCILTLDSRTFIAFSFIQNILCESTHFRPPPPGSAASEEEHHGSVLGSPSKSHHTVSTVDGDGSYTVNDNDADYMWLFTLDSVGSVTIYYIQNIALHQCGKAAVIKFTQTQKGLLYRLGKSASSRSSSNCAVAFGYLFDTSRGVATPYGSAISSDHNNSISSPAMIEWSTFFESGTLAHFTIDINQKHVFCNRMLGGLLPNDPVTRFVRHPSLRYNIFAAQSRDSGRLAIFDYSKCLDSRHCNDGLKLIYVVPYEPVLAFAWHPQYRRLICISQKEKGNVGGDGKGEYLLSVHVYKSKHGWYDVWQSTMRLNPKERIVEMMIAPFYHGVKKKKSHKHKAPQRFVVWESDKIFVVLGGLIDPNHPIVFSENSITLT